MTGVIIVGIPWYADKPDWRGLKGEPEVWGINDAWRVDPALPEVATRWFEMHTWKRTLRKRSPEHIRWLKEEHDFPIYMPRRVRCVPNSLAYPLREVRSLGFEIEGAGGPYRDTFGCSFSYMVALAVLEELDPIMLAAVYMLGSVEAYLELSSLSFWLGVAAARGHTLILEGGAVVPEQLYGYRERKAPEWLPDPIAEYLEHVEARKRQEQFDVEEV